MSKFKKISADGVIKKLKKNGTKYKWAQVHHTYIPNHDSFSGSNHFTLQNSMFRAHTGDRGWQDIGQHLTLFPDGLFVTGRDWNTQPAGIKGYNKGAFMIEIVGDFDKGHDKLEGDQLKSALKVYNYLTQENGATLMFHREKASKSCPGTGISKNKFEKAVKNFDGESTPDVKSDEKESKKEDKKDDGKLDVDGYLGKKTIESWQKALGSTADGVLSGQGNNSITKEIDSSVIKKGDDGSLVIKETQKLLGVDADGRFGSATLKAMQRALGTTTDGKLSSPSVVIKELQRRLNKDSLKNKLKSGKEDLDVDGYFGPDTIKAMQRYYGTTVDGKLSKPSTVLKKLQKTVGTKSDGYLGPKTITAMQKYFGTTADGKLSKPSLVIKSLQKALNNNKL